MKNPKDLAYSAPGITVILLLCLLLVGLAVCAALDDEGDEFWRARQEIIRRLWKPEEAPRDVSSIEISERLATLDIDVRKK